MNSDGGKVMTVGTRRRIHDADRDRLAAVLKRDYERGATLAQLTERTGHSSGVVRRVLAESGVVLRGSGGHRG